MSDEKPISKKARKGRSRASRTVLRRGQEIERVLVDTPFQLYFPKQGHNDELLAEERKAGEGCYVSGTIHSKRYYGVLIDQASLKAASMLHFEDEAAGLELNRKMEYQLEQNRMTKLAPNESLNKEDSEDYDRKRPAEQNHPSKRLCLGDPTVPDAAITSAKIAKFNALALQLSNQSIPVQKFRYIESQKNGGQGSPGYRILLATYVDERAAADDDPEKLERIKTACQIGGDFVGDHYYQYQVKSTALEVLQTNSDQVGNGLRMTLGFHRFLQTAGLPDWYPLTNLPVAQNKVLNILQMKKDTSGKLIYDKDVRMSNSVETLQRVKPIPMEDRSRFRVGVIGGGIAGLSCCLELFRICEQEKIDVEIVLVEARSRLGGRILTDTETFKTKDGASFPVDLGASWIHGIDQNPLAALAKEAGASFITTSEDVVMLQAGGQQVDPEKDDRAGELFDKLLDFAANDCWSSDGCEGVRAKQAAVRWYASVLRDQYTMQKDIVPIASNPPSHRQSSDTSVDTAVGRAILKHTLSEFSMLSEEERRMLLWNLKNVEYALGANVKDLSMKWWDIDERHAFEGDHVLLRQGYSTVIDHLLSSLKERGDRFECKLNFAVRLVEYHRKSSKIPYNQSRGFIELSDTCCITAQESKESIKCDFVVSALPLGVLKASTTSESDHRDSQSRLIFEPSLPFLKRDTIESVGFGLLNKVFLQFPFSFWDNSSILGKNCTQFGNASGVNQHHYMFLDVGKSLQPEQSSPSILMTLISGREAVQCEKMSNEDLVAQVMETLRTLFSSIDVPDPVAFKLTRWGSDQFSRGCYTFLTPGTTDQDFGVLQSPVNGNGDSLMLEGSETMRLFFAGEHTTALHPSMAHGALMSGMRAAKEVVESMHLKLEIDEGYDRLMPMSMFRYLNPKRDVRCSLCHKPWMRIREGNLLAFRKGTRQFLVHSNCAENSPEVEVFEGQWKDVLTAVNRSKTTECFLCNQRGATIVCKQSHCYRSYHYSCAEDTGWRFDSDGKEFYCDLHQNIEREESHRVSMQYYTSKMTSAKAPVCALCKSSEADETLGVFLAYMKWVHGMEHLRIVHERCIRNTTIIDIGEVKMSGIDHEFRNVFTAIERAEATFCLMCKERGASMLCSEQSCNACFHLSCAEKSGWNFAKQGADFRCLLHRAPQRDEESSEVIHLVKNDNEMTEEKNTNDISHVDIASGEISDDDSDAPDVTLSMLNGKQEERARLPSNIPLLDHLVRKQADSRMIPRLVRISRKSLRDRWNLDLFATCVVGALDRVLTVATALPDSYDALEEGDIVRAINGVKVGSSELRSLSNVFASLGQELDVILEIQRLRSPDNQWF